MPEGSGGLREGGACRGIAHGRNPMLRSLLFFHRRGAEVGEESAEKELLWVNEARTSLMNRIQRLPAGGRDLAAAIAC